MALRELLATFDVGVNQAQIQAADQALAALRAHAANAQAAVASIPGGVKIQADASSLKGMGSIVDSVKGALFGLFAIGGASALVSGLEDMISQGSRLNDLSEKLGVSTDELQQFAYAVGLSGVEAEGAYAALGKMSRVVGEAMTAGSTQAKDFAELGIAFKEADGQARPLIDIATDMADVVKHAGSEAEAAAKLTKVFGKSGAALIPAFKGGSEAIAQLAKEFGELGGGMSADFIKQADEAGDNIDRLKLVSKSLKVTLAAEVVPWINKGAVAMIDMYKQAKAATKDVDILHTALAGLAVGGLGLAIVKAVEFGGSLSKAFSLGLTGMLVVGAVALLALLFGDLYGLIQGNDSAIGEFLDKTYGLGASAQFAKELKDAWQELTIAMADPALDGTREALHDLGKGILPAVLGNFVRLVRNIENMVRLLSNAVVIVKQLAAMFDVLASPKEALFGLMSGEGPGALLDKKKEGQANETQARLASGWQGAKDAFGKLDIFTPTFGKGDKALMAPRPTVDQPSIKSVGTKIAAGAITLQNTIKIDVRDKDAATAVAKSVKATIADKDIDNSLATVLDDALEGAY